LLPEAVKSDMVIRIVIFLEAVALSEKLIINDPADSAIKSDGCANMTLTAPTVSIIW